MPNREAPQIIGIDEIPITPDEVIVLLLWHLGDVLMSTALFLDLVARHGRKLTYVTTPPCVPLLRNHPSLERIRVVDREHPRLLTRQEFEALYVLHREILPGHKTVYNLHLPVVLPRTPGHVIEWWGGSVGIDKPWREMRSSFYPDPGIDFDPPGEPYFFLGNGGSRSEIHWPMRRWRGLVDVMKERHPELRLVQLGVKNDALIDGVEDLRERTTLSECHLMLRQARGGVTNDSFLGHLAATTDTPTVMLWGPDSPSQFRPLGGGPTICLGGHWYRTPCRRNLCRFGYRAGLPCLALPSLRTVLAEVDRMLG